MLQIANINFYINILKQNYNSDVYLSIKNHFSENIEKDFSESEIYKGIKLNYYCNNKEELGVIIFLKFVGIYQTEVNYEYIYETITKIVISYKNKIIHNSKNNYSYKIAVKHYNVINTKDIISLLEKYYSTILARNKDKFYDEETNIDQIISATSKNIKKNEFFLKCHRTTKFRDIDIKIWETRQALACGLSITAIVMLGVTLEESLKIILKNDFEQQLLKTKDNVNLELLAEVSLKAEEKYGSLQLYNLIVAMHEKTMLIDEDERKHLMNIKDFIRNAFIHSDKSKIFDKDTKGRVDAFKIVGNQLKHTETTNLSMLQMSFAQGIMQKNLADDNAKLIFYEIEEFIHLISKRFWSKWQKHV